MNSSAKAVYYVYVTTRTIIVEPVANPKLLYKHLYSASQAEYMVARSNNVRGWKNHLGRIGAFVTRHYQDQGGRAGEVKAVDYGYERKTKVSDKQMGLL